MLTALRLQSLLKQLRRRFNNVIEKRITNVIRFLLILIGCNCMFGNTKFLIYILWNFQPLLHKVFLLLLYFRTVKIKKCVDAIQSIACNAQKMQYLYCANRIEFLAFMSYAKKRYAFLSINKNDL